MVPPRLALEPALECGDVGSLRLLRAGVLAVLLVIVASACGGGGDKSSESASPSTPKPQNAAGAKVFADAGCGNCHTMAAAESTGNVGPSLDDVKPDQAKVVRQVTNGGVGMPSFRDKLTKQQIDDVAEFVSDETRKATGGGSVAAGYKPDDTKVEDCGEDFKCLEQAFANIAYNDGPEEALDRFDEAIKTPGAIERNCHRIVHAIGAGALSHFDGNVGKAFVAGRASCTSGYYHGILERAFLESDVQDLGAASREFCSDPEIRKTEFIAYQCVHGLGHGLMIFTGYDLPESLKTCDKLGPDALSCTGGVFMENYQSSYGVKSRWLREKDLIYPCNAVAEKHKFYCYDMVTARILPKVDWNWKKTAKWCRKSEPRWVPICFQSMGRDASGFTRLDPARILAICKVAKEMATQCVHSAARDMVYTDVNADRAKVLCNTAPTDQREFCWIGIGSILGSFDPDNEKRRALCDEATTEYRAACYRGAAVT